MLKFTKIHQLVSILDMALREYPGPGLIKYRCKDPTVTTATINSTIGHIWIDLPIKFITALCGMTEDDIRELHKHDMDGNIYFNNKHNRQVVTICIHRDKYSSYGM